MTSPSSRPEVIGAALLGVAMLLAGALAPAGQAAAQRPAQTVGPSPLGSPAALPTIDLRSRTVDLVPVTRDLGNVAEERPAGRIYDVRLNANVLFAKDSAVIQPAARRRLAQIIDELKRRGPGKVTITGYTDDLGTAEHGLELSRRRAAAVHQIVGPELPGHAVTSLGRGEADPLVPNRDEASRARNRRVEIHYERS